MPLPVAATSYTHNPLTGVRATQAGKDVGSKFSNVVEGFTEGLSSFLDTTQKLQEIKNAPLEQERKTRAAELAELKFDLNQKKEERLAQDQEFEQDLSEQKLDLEERKFKTEQDLKNARIRKIDRQSALAAQNQAQSNIVNGAIDDLVTKGRPDNIVAILQDESPAGRRRVNALGSEIAKDVRSGQAVVERLQDAIAEGRVSQTDAMRLRSFIGTLSPIKNIQTAEELAKEAPGIFNEVLGVIPDTYSEIKIEKGKDEWTFKEQLRNGKIEDIGPIAIPGIDAKTTNRLLRDINAWNKQARMLKQINKTATQAARNRADLQTRGQQTGGELGGGLGAELPTKLSKAKARRTPAQRVGLSRTVPSEKGEVVERPLTKRQDEARRNLRAFKEREAAKNDPTLKSPNAFLR